VKRLFRADAIHLDTLPPFQYIFPKVRFFTDVVPFLTAAIDALVKSCHSRTGGNPEGMQRIKNTGFPFLRETLMPLWGTTKAWK